MNIVPTALPGLNLIESAPFADHRGQFARLFSAPDLAPLLGGRRIVHVNHSLTRQKGAFRGLHYQRPPHAEMKFIRCLKGRVADYALDLRAGSPTFLQWHREELNEGTAKTICIPEGFAHGFQVLEEDSELLYLHTEAYFKESEDGVRHDDPRIGLTLTLPVTDISERDLNHPLLTEDFKGIVL